MNKALIPIQIDKSLHDAALATQSPEEKAKAVWEVFRRLNLDTVMHRKDAIREEIWLALGGRTSSAVDILGFTNKSVYQVHLSLVQHGYSYQGLREAYGCDEAICARLFEIALQGRSKLFNTVASVAEGMQTSKERDADALLLKSLEIWSEFYPASHIVKQYSEEQGIEEPAL
jgi:hypothetical protein